MKDSLKIKAITGKENAYARLEVTAGKIFVDTFTQEYPNGPMDDYTQVRYWSIEEAVDEFNKLTGSANMTQKKLEVGLTVKFTRDPFAREIKFNGTCRLIKFIENDPIIAGAGFQLWQVENHIMMELETLIVHPDWIIEPDDEYQREYDARYAHLIALLDCVMQNVQLRHRAFKNQLGTVGDINRYINVIENEVYRPMKGLEEDDVIGLTAG